MTDSAVPPVANRAGRLSAVAEWQMLHGLAARDGERGDHGALLAWRQGMPGPALVTSRPGAARGAASGAVLAGNRWRPPHVRPGRRPAPARAGRRRQSGSMAFRP